MIVMKTTEQQGKRHLFLCTMTEQNTNCDREKLPLSVLPCVWDVETHRMQFLLPWKLLVPSLRDL